MPKVWSRRGHSSLSLLVSKCNVHLGFKWVSTKCMIFTWKNLIKTNLFCQKRELSTLVGCNSKLNSSWPICLRILRILKYITTNLRNRVDYGVDMHCSLNVSPSSLSMSLFTFQCNFDIQIKNFTVVAGNVHGWQALGFTLWSVNISPPLWTTLFMSLALNCTSHLI